jgi:EAL domain-containing protein (putative c-di-GMP-specific phosphodiesterase class I)
LRLELVAEGIETEEMLQRLIAMGCQTGQGYLFSRPMPASEVAEWIAAASSSGRIVRDKI